MLKRAALLAVAGILTLGSSLPAMAADEEIIEPAGYHVYDSTEDSETDTWYGIARGTYLRSGESSITKVDSTHVISSGKTLGHVKADKVYVRVYLDKSDTGKSGTWGTVNYWTGTATNASVASVSSGSYKVTKNKYYRTTGAHSVTESGVTEATDTTTNSLLIN